MYINKLKLNEDTRGGVYFLFLDYWCEERTINL